MTQPRFTLPQLGSLWMLVAALGFAIMGALVKHGASKFNSAELVFYRSLFGLIAMYAYVRLSKLPLQTPVLGKQLSRAFTGFVSLVMFFYAIAHLPLATAITLNYTSPLFLAAFMPFMLKEKPKTALLVAIAIGFIGVVMLLKPSFDKDDMMAGAIGLLSGMGAGLAYIQVKQLGNLNEPDWRTVFYFTLFSTVGSGIWMLAHQFHPLTWQDIPLLTGLGISATLAQLALTRAYRTGKTLTVAGLAYFTVVISSFFGMIFWQERLSANEWFAIGLIIFSGIISIHATPNSAHH